MTLTLTQKIKDLWKLCFNDSNEFVDMYFKYRFHLTSNIYLPHGKRVVAALQMISYPMTFCNKEIPTSYISGACTHPDFRGRGIMKKLLMKAFKQMSGKKVLVSTLIPAEPWLFDYYQTMGYVPVFNHSEKKVNAGSIHPPAHIKTKAITEFDEDSFSFFDKKMHKRPCCIQHTREDYNIVLNDLKLSGGAVFVAYQQEKIGAMAFACCKNGSVEIAELLSNNKELEKAVIHRAADHFKTDAVRIITPPTGKHSQPLGMARIIYVKAFLQMYAAANPEIEMSIEITDDQLLFNNGIYRLAEGKSSYSKATYPKAQMRLTIAELTQMLLAPHKPYMSLMLN